MTAIKPSWKESYTQEQRLADGEANLQAALAYLRLGWSVLALCPPDHVGIGKNHAKECESPGKAPWHKWKEFEDRLPTEEEVRKWWKRQPNSNVGLALGPVSKLIRIDVEGVSAEAQLLELSGGDLPRTLEFASGRIEGGRGLLYAIPDGMELATTYQSHGSTQEVRFQAKGAQTVLPPSRHYQGQLYHWLPGQDPASIIASPAPLWLLEKLALKAQKSKTGSASKTSEEWDEIFDGVEEGSRNTSATSVIGGLLNSIRDLTNSSDVQTAWRYVKLWNNQNNPPLLESELRTIFTSILKKESNKRREQNDEAFNQMVGGQINESVRILQRSPETIRDDTHPPPGITNGNLPHPEDDRTQQDPSESPPGDTNGCGNPLWHLIIVKSDPVEYRLKAPYWSESHDLSDGYLSLSADQILNWTSGGNNIRKASLKQAQKIVPAVLKGWANPDGHLDKLLKVATVIETTPESKRSLYIFGFVYRYLNSASIAKSDEVTEQPQWPKTGRPTRDMEGNIFFKLDHLKKAINNAKADFAHRELTRLLEDFGFSQSWPDRTRWWKITRSKMDELGRITKEENMS